MKIFLCNPPTGSFLRDERCQIDIKSRVAENMREPIQMLYLTGLLQAEGHEVFLRDYSFPRFSIQDVCQDLSQFRPEWFYIETTQGTFSKDLNFVRTLKEQGFDFKVILKAPFVDAAYLAQKINLSAFPASLGCYFITRNFETSIKAIINCPGNIPKMCCGYLWKDGAVTPLQEGGAENADNFVLDEYPIPPRYFLDKYDYVRPDTGEPIAYIYTAKGCPYPCIFCSAPVYLGKSINVRSVASVIAELEDCINRYGIRNFFFRSDTFTFDKAWVLQFCHLIKERGLKIRWGANSRVDKIDAEIVVAMRSAGCDIIGFGIESGCDEILRKIKKVITTDQIRRAHSIVRNAGIHTFFHCIVGFPWDTRKTIRETKKFLLDISPDFIEVNVPYPLMGTDLFAFADEHHLFMAHDLEAYSHVNPICRTFTLTPQEVLRCRKDILRSFYLRPRYIVSKLIFIRHPRIFLNYVKWGLSFLRKVFSK